MSLRRRFHLPLLAAVALSPLWAQVSQTGPVAAGAPDPISITVTASPLPVSTVPASLTVITREDIERRQVETAADLFRHLPHLSLSQTGPRGSLTTVTLRGGDPNFTLVLIDGVPVNDLSNVLGGSYDFSSLSTDNIERIEIVRGPLSSLYGSDAIGGVVHIITRQGEEHPSGTVSLEGGSFGTARAAFHSAGARGAFNYSTGVSWMRIGEQIERDRFELGTLSFRGGWDVSDTQQLSVTLRAHHKEAVGFPENSGGPEYALAPDLKDSQAQELVLGVGFRDQARPWWLYSVDFDWFGRWEDVFTPAIADSFPPGRQFRPPLDTQSRFHRLRASHFQTFQLSPKWTASAGVQVRGELGQNDTLIAGFLPSEFDLERTIGGVAGEAVYEGDRLALTLGVRGDKAEGFQAQASPRVGAAYRIAQGTRIKSSWGRGFKLPSFYALGEPNIGNPELRPETSRAWDLGIEHRLWRRGPTVGLTGFWNNYEDLIDFSPSEFRLVNRREAQTRGLELDARIPVHDRLEVSGELTYVAWELKGTDEKLRDRPRWRGGAHLSWAWNRKGRLTWDTVWVGPRFDFQVPVPELAVAGGYSSTGLAASYDLPGNLTAFARIDNLFDAEFLEYVGFRNPGLFLRGGVRFRIFE